MFIRKIQKLIYRYKMAQNQNYVLATFVSLSADSLN